MSDPDIDTEWDYSDERFDLTDDALDFFNSLFDIDGSGSTESAVDEVLATVIPPPIENKQLFDTGPLLIDPLSRKEYCSMTYTTAFLPKYYKNQRKNLMCFPRCGMHGDYAAAKIQGLEHNPKGATFVTCAFPVEVKLKLDKKYSKGVNMKSLRVLSRIKRANADEDFATSAPSTPSSPESDESSISPFIDQNLRPGMQVSSSSLLMLLQNHFTGVIQSTSATKATIITSARVWKVPEIQLSRKRHTSKAERKDALYVFETVLLQRSSYDAWSVVTSVESIPFQILSTKTLQREVAKLQKKKSKSQSKSHSRGIQVPRSETAAESADPKVASGGDKPKKLRIMAAGIDHSSRFTEALVDSTLNQLTKQLERMRAATASMEDVWNAMPTEERTTFYHNEYQYFEETMAKERARLASVSQELHTLLGIVSGNTNSNDQEAAAELRLKQHGQDGISENGVIVVQGDAHSNAPILDQPGNHFLERATQQSESLSIPVEDEVLAQQHNYVEAVPADTFPKYSLCVAFVLWLPFFGGFFGAHQHYLGRSRVAWFQTFTAGGMCVNWVFDLFRLPMLVHQANAAKSTQDPQYRNAVDFLDVFPAWTFFGLIGLHHLLLGRKDKFLISVFSFNSLGLGYVHDLFTLPLEVRQSARARKDRDGPIPLFYVPPKDRYDPIIAYRAWFPLGLVGAHRFYLDDVPMAIAQMLTGCGVFLGWCFEGAILMHTVQQANIQRGIQKAEVIKESESEHHNDRMSRV